jgi:hypothetical protein
VTGSRRQSICLAVARASSAALNPLTTAGATLIWLHAWVRPRSDGGHLALSLALAVAVPAAYIVWLRRSGRIDRLFTADRAARRPALWLSAASTAVGAAVLWLWQAPLAFTILMLCYAAQAALAACLTRAWLISLHALSIWAVPAAATTLAGPAGFWLVLPALVVCWSRTALAAHTPAEVAAGGLLGFGSTWLIFRLLLPAPG